MAGPLLDTIANELDSTGVLVAQTSGGAWKVHRHPAVDATDARSRPACVGCIDEWHVDLRKPKGKSDMGKAGLSWEDGGWQPFHTAKEAHPALF